MIWHASSAALISIKQTASYNQNEEGGSPGYGTVSPLAERVLNSLSPSSLLAGWLVQAIKADKLSWLIQSVISLRSL